MAKRPVEDVDHGAAAYPKRQKTSNLGVTKAATPVTEIRSGRQLRQLLAFDQDRTNANHGIQSLKAFLQATREDGDTFHISILKDYLESSRTRELEDKPATYLPDLMQTWSFASQSNDELLLSAVPAVIAMLLGILSDKLEMSEHGIGICRTVLQRSHLDLLMRGLTAPKGKTFVISPVLRLLKEICTFDGGVMAKHVFRARDYTLKGLARNLYLQTTGDESEDRTRPSARTNAVRLLLSLLKYLPVDGKRELLSQREIITALIRDLKDDPPYVVRDILETLKAHVLQEEKLPRDAKAKLLNSTSLGRIALLYGYNQPDEESSNLSKSIDTVAHNFLVWACTSTEAGVLHRQSAFYPRGIDPDEIKDITDNQAMLDLGLDSVEWMGKYADKVPLRNRVLSDFIQSLRPWSNARQSQLLLSIFASAPELVAEYFFSKKSFSFEPKLTATWIGYSTFLFSSLQLPIPAYFGHEQCYAQLPPPPSIVLESILPQPLSQKVLRSCLLHPQKLIAFFAIRLLCVAFNKFRSALRMYQEAAVKSSPLWSQAAAALTDAFSKRCPSIKDVIHTFRNMSDTDMLQREAITRLLVLYYEAVPSIALVAKFDVAGILAQRLCFIEDSQLSTEDRSLCMMEFENLFQFAHFSPGMRWFSKVEGLHMSPYMAMLKLAAEAPIDVPLLKLKAVLVSLTEENQIFQTQTYNPVLDTFIILLKTLQGASYAPQVYDFLDDCISRCATTSIKYIFGLEEITARVHEAGDSSRPFSLLTLAIQEQWPFLIKSIDEPLLHQIAQFIAHYLAALLKIKEDKKVIKAVMRDLSAALPKDSITRNTIESTRDMVDMVKVSESKTKRAAESDKDLQKNTSTSNNASLMETMLEDTDPLVYDNSALVKWTHKDIEDVIEGGHAAALVMLLSSETLSVRKEAVTNIAKFTAKLKDSTVEDKDQIWLLLSELIETAKDVVDQEALPNVISAFAAHSIPVLRDPLHFLYPKINGLLSQGPTWEIDKIPLMYKILDEPPSVDDAYYQETNWFLSYMLASLRTPADMAIYRKRRVFEKLLSIWNNAYLAPGMRNKILRILLRATTIEGGGATLITRFSAISFLQAQIALGSGMPLKALMKRILEFSDHEWVQKWSKGVDVEAVEADTMNFL